jgi:hypothetical protein
MTKQVYICSAGHSGSTLLDMMLGSHPRCESVGEVLHLPMDMAMNRDCACGQPMKSCMLWPSVVKTMGIDPYADPYALNLGYVVAKVGDKRRTSSMHRVVTRAKNYMRLLKLQSGLDWMRLLTPGFDEGIDNTIKLYNIVRELTGKDIVVDSTKHYLRAIELYRRQPDATKVILLVRNGKGVFYSGLKRGFGRNYSLHAWLNHYERALPLLEKYIPEEHRITVRYEDIVLNTKGTLESLCDFLGINWNERMLQFRSVVHHNVNGNDVKYESSSDLHLDTGWQSKLTAEDMAFFERYAGYLNRQFGYT